MVIGSVMSLLGTFAIQYVTPFTGPKNAFIGCMLLSTVALLFMRNQIRPIRRLADAAEAIGKGRDVPGFKLEGAAEVRQAAAALLVMRDRLRRQITQRTAMLAGVSHDLRTPLTRMKLQLALMPESDETLELANDIAEMETMLDAYLAFARGEEAEPDAPVDLAELLAEAVEGDRVERLETAQILKVEAVAGGISGAGGLSLSATLVGNLITNTVEATISNSSVTSSGSVSRSASDVAPSTVPSWILPSNETSNYNNAISSAPSGVDLTHANILAVVVNIAGAGGVAGAISGLGNEIKNTVESEIISSTITAGTSGSSDVSLNTLTNDSIIAVSAGFGASGRAADKALGRE